VAPARDVVYRRRVGLDGPVRGLLVLALITSCLCAAVGGALYRVEVIRAARRVARLLAPPPEPPAGPPIERIARDVRRLRAELSSVPSGTPMVRRIALSGAYDDSLADACRALGVPDTLHGLAPGLDRDTERLHVECELEQVGLRLTA
jgi:hypothetical protein